MYVHTLFMIFCYRYTKCYEFDATLSAVRSVDVGDEDGGGTSAAEGEAAAATGCSFLAFWPAAAADDSFSALGGPAAAFTGA